MHFNNTTLCTFLLIKKYQKIKTEKLLLKMNSVTLRRMICTLTSEHSPFYVSLHSFFLRKIFYVFLKANYLMSSFWITILLMCGCQSRRNKA